MRPKRIEFVIALIAMILLTNSCEQKRLDQAEVFEEPEFKKLVQDFRRRTFPEKVNSSFILRLDKYLDMTNSELNSLMRQSFPSLRISGNETTFDISGSRFRYTPGEIRFISRVTIAGGSTVGFRAIHESLALGIIDLLQSEGFQRFGIGKAPEGTYIYRKDGYSIVISYNDYHNIWDLKIHRY